MPNDRQTRQLGNNFLDTNTFKVERNIPLPPKRHRGQYSGINGALAMMKEGDSFLVPATGDVNLKKLHGSIYSRAKNMGFKIAVRYLPEGMRVWRVPEETTEGTTTSASVSRRS